MTDAGAVTVAHSCTREFDALHHYVITFDDPNALSFGRFALRDDAHRSVDGAQDEAVLWPGGDISDVVTGIDQYLGIVGRQSSGFRERSDAPTASDAYNSCSSRCLTLRRCAGYTAGEPAAGACGQHAQQRASPM